MLFEIVFIINNGKFLKIFDYQYKFLNFFLEYFFIKLNNKALINVLLSIFWYFKYF